MIIAAKTFKSERVSKPTSFIHSHNKETSVKLPRKRNSEMKSKGFIVKDIGGCDIFITLN